MSASGARFVLPALLVGLSAIGSLGAVACNGCDSKQATVEASAAPATALAPVSAPSGLIAELRMARPAADWPALRNVSGLDVLPLHPEMLLTELLDLPHVLAGDLAADGPIVAAWFEQQGRTESAVALRLSSEREFVAALTTGAEAAFSVEANASGAQVLTRKGARGGSVLVVQNHHLLAGKDPGTLITVAPYLVAEVEKATDGTAPLEIWMPRSALAFEMGPLIRGAWSRYAADLENAEQAGIAQHGRAADFADPKAVILGMSSLVESLATFLESTDELRLTVTPEPERLTLSVELSPAANGKAREVLSALGDGALSQLGTLPAQARVVVASYQPDDDPQRFASQMAAQLTTFFGPRLSEREHQQVARAFTDLATGFTGPTLYGSLALDEGQALFVRSSIQDPGAFGRGLAEVSALCRLPAISRLLHGIGVDIEVSPLKSSDFAGVTLRRAASSAMGSAKGVGSEASHDEGALLWQEREGTGYVVLAEKPQPALAALREPRRRLADLPQPVRIVDFDAERAALAILLRTGSDASLEGVGLTLGWDGSRGRLRLRASRGAVTDWVTLLQKLGGLDATR